METGNFNYWYQLAGYIELSACSSLIPNGVIQMTWVPLNDNHAIERVRIYIQFKNQLNLQKLSEASEQTRNSETLGFQSMMHLDSVINRTPTHPSYGIPTSNIVTEGWLLIRHTKEKSIEEAAFCVGEFSYMTTEYERWENLLERHGEIFNSTLEKIIQNCGIERIRLEYWNKFAFKGNSSDADVSEIISSPEHIDHMFPKTVFEKKSLWHSHIGWYEDIDSIRTLVQRNIDFQDAENSNVIERTLYILTLVEMRQLPDSTTVSKVSDYLMKMHNKSIYAIGLSLSEAMRKKIGLNLGEYEL